MLKNISKLCSLYEKNKRSALNRHLYSWRETALRLKIKQE
jgi:hypothetical protein